MQSFQSHTEQQHNDTDCDTIHLEGLFCNTELVRLYNLSVDIVLTDQVVFCRRTL